MIIKYISWPFFGHITQPTQHRLYKSCTIIFVSGGLIAMVLYSPETFHETLQSKVCFYDNQLMSAIIALVNSAIITKLTIYALFPFISET